MQREELKALDLSDEQVTGVRKLNNTALEELKSKLEIQDTELNNYKGAVDERDKQLKSLQKENSDNEELQKQIKELQESNKTATDELNAKIQNIKKDSAIKLALKDSRAKDTDLVYKALNLDDVKIDEKGHVKGLDEQVENLQESHDYMFESAPKSDDGQNSKPISATISGNPSGTQNGSQNMDLSKMSYGEIANLKNNNPEEYQKLQTQE